MINYKTPEEIVLMREAGKRLQEVVNRLIPEIEPGMTTRQVDDRAQELIKKSGGEISFNRVKGYNWATCLPINEQVVHTPPSSRILKKGDVLTVDIGVFYRGFHSDYATTFSVGGKGNPETERFLEVGKSTLKKAIAAAVKDHRIGEISAVIEREIKGAGYFILKELTGHGIGRELHEDPYVFGFRQKAIEKTPKMIPGLAIAIEIIYSMGTEEIAYEEGNDWSIISADKSLTACFEDTIAITEAGTLKLT